MCTEEYFPCMKVQNMFYLRQLEQIWIFCHTEYSSAVSKTESCQFLLPTLFGSVPFSFFFFFFLQRSADAIFCSFSLVVISINLFCQGVGSCDSFQSSQSNCQHNFATRHRECLSVCGNCARRYRLQRVHITFYI